MPPRERLSLFVFIDAFGWEILRGQEFLADVLAARSPLQTVFGYSSTCDPTILTGLAPRDHGHFSFFCYDPAASPFGLCRYLRFLPKSVTRRGRVRRLLSRALRWWHGYTGYFQIYNMPFDKLPLFDYSEKRDLYMPGGINSGALTVFDHLRSSGAPFLLSDWRASEERNLAALEQGLERGEARFGYVYLAAMDAVLHAHGARSKAGAEKIAWYERRLWRVLDIAAKSYQETRLFVFSDHGMTDVRDTCDLMARINALDLVFGRDYAACYDSTMARFWLLNDKARPAIEAALAQEPKGDILSDAKLAEYGCDFPDRRYGDLFFLMKPGVLLCPSFMGETRLAGMHGYAPEDKDSVAMFATNVRLERPPARLADMFGLMMSEAGLEGAGAKS